MKLTLNDISQIPNADILNADKFTGISSVFIDSRKVKKGAMFVAIVGEKFDGHDFINTAIKNGVSAVVVEKSRRIKYSSLNITVVSVDDTTLAYGDIAKIWRRKNKTKIISITGSNGKTSTKEILTTILEQKYSVDKSVANNNNHIGVPLTILTAKKSADFLVAEHGTNHFGEIEYTAKIAEPDYALITNIGNSHTEFLVDKEGVFKEKNELFNECINNGGWLFVNTDDPVLLKTKPNYSKILTYGFKGKPDVMGKITAVNQNGNSEIEICYKNKIINTNIPLLGKANAQNFLAACAIGLKIGLNSKQISRGAEKLQDVKGRLAIIKGKKNLVIDDTYNASPDSYKAALEVIKSIKSFRKKIVIAGDIFELGGNSKQEHKDLAKYFTKVISKVLLIGKEMKVLHTELSEKGIDSEYFQKREQLLKSLKEFDFTNSAILVKGSRGMKMEEFIHAIN